MDSMHFKGPALPTIENAIKLKKLVEQLHHNYTESDNLLNQAFTEIG